MSATKTYANRSNARRAAKAAGLDLNTLVFSYTVDGTAQAWTWEAAATAPAKPYRIVQGKPARVAARKAALAAEKAAQAAKAAAVATPKAGAAPTHKEFALYGRSAILSPVQFVHQFLNAKGGDLTRKQAIQALSEAGVNYSTARTQYQRWFTARKG